MARPINIIKADFIKRFIDAESALVSEKQFYYSNIHRLGLWRDYKHFKDWLWIRKQRGKTPRKQYITMQRMQVLELYSKCNISINYRVIFEKLNSEIQNLWKDYTDFSKTKSRYILNNHIQYI